MRDELDALVERTSRVSDADAEALPLRAAEADLMEEIMSTSVLESLPGTEPPRRHRGARRLVALAGAAAAVTAGVLVVQPGGDEQPAWAAEVLEVAESAPRLIVDDPDWRITRADEFGVERGETTFSDGTDELELSWLPGDSYDDVIADRHYNMGHEDSIVVAGHEAALMQYADSSVFTTVWQQNGYTMQAVGRTFDDQDSYEDVLRGLTETDVDTWLSAMPENVVQPDQGESVVTEMLDGLPLPAGFDSSTLAEDGVRDRYHVGARVAGAVACAWIAQWAEATETGDTAAADQAVAAMATSRDWPVLQELQAGGDYPDVLWEYADAVANGGLDAEGRSITAEVTGGDSDAVGIAYREVLGCS
ncbi:hypothetical protein [Jiangella mangrovi]|uniref:Uncharacterized protein n=1 Tax=Jiangella mangrovi TaxID=1524084 RepID=A0A7W9GNU3_9ACTN|nr:hypothetical protein [Jiangella mangrovi]MBB5787309.1 hypothetical protein [Jiangella mangrovi]